MIQTQGTLSNGKKWLFDGQDIYTYDVQGDEWIVPTWYGLSDVERDELAAIGCEMNRLAGLAKDYGKAWMEQVLADGDVTEWGGMGRDEFFQALSNANSPAFTVSDGDGEPLDDGDGTLAIIAMEAAWEALEAALEED